MAQKMPQLTVADDPVSRDWEETWRHTPFQTFKYQARTIGVAGEPYVNLPGGNCFDFALAFSTRESITAPRLMCYEFTDNGKTISHGNLSCKNKAHTERFYTVDSGFAGPVRMPDNTAGKFMYKPKEKPMKVTDNPPPVYPNGRNRFHVYEHEWDAGGGVWTSKHYPMGMVGSHMMESKGEAVVREMAARNATGQSAALFMGRKLVGAQHNVGGWSGGRITVYLADGNGGKRGDVIIVYPRKQGTTEPTEQEKAELSVYDAVKNALIPAGIARLASDFVTDGVADTHWTGEFSDCLDAILKYLRDNRNP